ncbi:MAG: hypothetical protein QOG67_2539 [Verrucomicrobiota bacterium]
MSTPSLLTLSEVARRLSITGQRVIDLHARGVIVPDFIASNGSILFREERLKELKTAVANVESNYGLTRAIKANSRQKAK